MLGMWKLNVCVKIWSFMIGDWVDRRTDYMLLSLDFCSLETLRVFEDTVNFLFLFFFIWFFAYINKRVRIGVHLDLVLHLREFGVCVLSLCWFAQWSVFYFTWMLFSFFGLMLFLWNSFSCNWRGCLDRG